MSTSRHLSNMLIDASVRPSNWTAMMMTASAERFRANRNGRPQRASALAAPPAPYQRVAHARGQGEELRRPPRRLTVRQQRATFAPRHSDGCELRGITKKKTIASITLDSRSMESGRRLVQTSNPAATRFIVSTAGGVIGWLALSAV